MDGPVRRPLVLLVALVMMAGAFAGCSDSAKEEKLREGAMKSGDVDTFHVPKGTKRLSFTFSTQTETKVDCSDIRYMYQPMCFDSEGGDGDEQIQFVAGPERIEEEGGAPPVLVTLTHGEKSTKTVLDPEPGTWLLGATTPDGAETYEGPASAKVAIPGAAAGDGVLNLGSFWDILGILIAVAGFLGAWLIYRRRARFLSSQLHRIDDTFTRFSDDLHECRTNLIELKKELNIMLVKRKLEEPQYLILEKRIEQYLRDLDVPGNRHGGRAAPEFVTVFESEEETLGAGTAIERLRQRRVVDD